MESSLRLLIENFFAKENVCEMHLSKRGRKTLRISS